MRNPVLDNKGPITPKGEQCFVNYMYVDAGMVEWTRNGAKAPQWEEPDGNEVGYPTGAFGVRLLAQKSELIGPIFELDKPWEANYNMYFTAIHYEDGLYRAWYSCIPPDHLKQKDARYQMASGQVLCMAESKDGVHWEKPNLGLQQYYGQDTNICFGRDLSPYGFQSGSIFVDPNGSPKEKYKMIYVGLKPVKDLAAAKKKYLEIFGDSLDPNGLMVIGGNPYVKGLFGATSFDGLHWKCIEEPLLVQPSDTLNTCIWDSNRKAYIAYIRVRHGNRRAVGRIESKDFFSWKQPPEIVLKAPLEWSPCDDIYTNNRMDYPESNIKLMFPNIYHRFTDSRNIFLASSQDDMIWEFVPGGAVVTGEEYGNWCAGDLNPGLGLVPLTGNKIAMPIMGYARPHKFCRGGEQKLGKPGLAVWEKGRLAALVAEERGFFSTPKVLLNGNRIVLNYKTAFSGSLKMELRNEKGEVIKGYSFTDCDIMSGDKIGHTVSWNGNKDLSSIYEKTIIMAFEMCTAKLYSFEFVKK